MKINEEVISDVISKLMRVEEYEKIQHPIPYVFELTNADNSKSILFYGSKHSANPDDSMFRELKKTYENFKPDLVMVEAAPGPKAFTIEKFNEEILDQTIEEVIKRRGEPGFAIRLAVEQGVEWVCPEPNRKDEAEYLLNFGFSKQEIQAWSLFRSALTFNTNRGDRTFEEFADSATTNFLVNTGWEMNNSTESIILMGNALIGVDIDIKNNLEIKNYISPGSANRMQLLSKLSWEYRDKTIMGNIIAKFTEYNRIFIVYGASHAVVQEPALRYLFSL